MVNNELPGILNLLRSLQSLLFGGSTVYIILFENVLNRKSPQISSILSKLKRPQISSNFIVKKEWEPCHDVHSM